MASTVNDTLAEAQIALIIATNVEITLHTADPGKVAATALTTAVAPYTYAEAGWAAAAAHVASGGRRRGTSVQIPFGNATAAETLTHIGLRHVASGFFVSAPLTVSQVTSIGNPVLIEIGDLGIYAAGAA